MAQSAAPTCLVEEVHVMLHWIAHKLCACGRRRLDRFSEQPRNINLGGHHVRCLVPQGVPHRPAELGLRELSLATYPVLCCQPAVADYLRRLCLVPEWFKN
jgi:hypothetical protein